MDVVIWISIALVMFFDYWENFNSFSEESVATLLPKFYKTFLARYFVGQILRFRESSLFQYLGESYGNISKYK